MTKIPNTVHFLFKSPYHHPKIGKCRIPSYRTPPLLGHISWMKIVMEAVTPLAAPVSWSLRAPHGVRSVRWFFALNVFQAFKRNTFNRGIEPSTGTPKYIWKRLYWVKDVFFWRRLRIYDCRGWITTLFLFQKTHFYLSVVPFTFLVLPWIIFVNQWGERALGFRETYIQ